MCACQTCSRDINLMKYENDFKEIKNSDIPIMDLASTGSQIVKNVPECYITKNSLVLFNEKNNETNNDVDVVVEDEVEVEFKQNNKQLSMAEFLEDFKI